MPEGLYGGRSDNNREAGKWRNFYLNNTYKGLRLVAQDYNLYYSIWCTNETEFYDLKVCLVTITLLLHISPCLLREGVANAERSIQSDTSQVVNRANDHSWLSTYEIAGRPVNQILPRLDALIMVLKTCKDSLCSYPWKALHPDGKVHDLKDALHPRFDDFYAAQPKMTFSSCPLAYFAELENQEPIKPWTGKVDEGPVDQNQAYFDYAMHWHLLT